MGCPQISIQVPHEAIAGSGRSSQDQVRVQFVYYKNSKLFRDRRRSWAGWDMPVLSVKLANISVSNLSNSVQYIIPSSPLTRQTARHICVYWDPNGKSLSVHTFMIYLVNNEFKANKIVPYSTLKNKNIKE